MTSEIQVALGIAVDTQPAEATTTVEDLTDPEAPPRTETVLVGGSLIFAGNPDYSPVDPAEGAATWTTELCVYAPQPPTAELFDFAEIARLWTARITEILVSSGAVITVTAASAWTFNGGMWAMLPSGYPGTVARRITLAPNG